MFRNRFYHRRFVLKTIETEQSLRMRISTRNHMNAGFAADYYNFKQPCCFQILAANEACFRYLYFLKRSSV